MFINTSILIHHFRQNHHILQSRSTGNPSLCSLRIYDDLTPRPGHLYIIRPEQLAFFDSEEENIALLCCGLTEAPDLSLKQDYILLRDNLDLTTLCNELNDIFDLYNSWEAQLNLCKNGIPGIQKMLDISRDILRGSIILSNFHFNYLAYTRDFENSIKLIREKHNGQTPPYIAEELLTNPDYLKVQNSRNIFEYPIHDGVGTIPALCYNLFRENEDEYRARILFAPDTVPATEDQYYLLDFLARKLNVLYNETSDYSLPFPSFNGLRKGILKCIEKAPSSISLLAPTLKEVHWNPTDEYLLLKFTPYFLGSNKEINAVSRSQLEIMYPDSCAVLYEDNIVLVVNLSKNKIHKRDIETDLKDNLSLFLRENLYKVGISNHFHDFSGVHSAYLEASAALQIGNIKNSMFWYYRFSDYALDYILDKCKEEIDSRSLCYQELFTLMDYDKMHDTDLTNALRTYIECQFNVTHAAEKLFVHRTTLLKHLKKITQITDIDLSDIRTRIHLAISFQLLDETEGK